MKKTFIGILLIIVFSWSGIKVQAVAGLPDLVIDDWFRLAKSPQENTPGFYYMNIRITNMGSQTIKEQTQEFPYNLVVRYEIKDSNGNVKATDYESSFIQSYSYVNNELKPGQSAVGFRGVHFTVGDTITFTADPENHLAEADETNNIRTFIIDQNRLANLVEPLPDLVIKEIFSEYKGASGVFLKICNEGLAMVDFSSGIFTDLYYQLNQAGGSMSFPLGNVVDDGGNGLNPLAIDLFGQGACWLVKVSNSENLIKKWHNQISVDINQQKIIDLGGGAILIQEIDYTNNSLTKEFFGQQVFAAKKTNQAKKIWNKLKGRILLQVQRKGEAYYLEPKSQKIYYLQNGATAYQVMRETGLGISEGNYTILNSASAEGKKLRTSLSGRIVLRAQAEGEAYYINPKDLSIIYLADGAAAYNIMRSKGEGITSDNLAQILDY